MKNEQDSDRTLSRLLAAWKVEPTPQPDFQSQVRARLDTDAKSEDKIVRPLQFFGIVDRRLWLSAAAACALFAVPLANFTAAQQNRSRLEQGRERYLKSIIPVSSVTTSLPDPTR
jgi:hypothetical protein